MTPTPRDRLTDVCAQRGASGTRYGQRDPACVFPVVLSPALSPTGYLGPTEIPPSSNPVFCLICCLPLS